MATRRMISKQIVSSDDYLSLSFDAQALYIQLTIDADEFGFTTGVNRIRRSIGADATSVDELEHERFIIRFESGAVVIRHWFLANFGLEFNKSNRILSTNYLKELATLDIDEDGAYILSDRNVAVIREQQIKSGRLNPNQLKVVQYIFKAEHVDDKNKNADQGTGQSENEPEQTANPVLNNADERPEQPEPPTPKEPEEPEPTSSTASNDEQPSKEKEPDALEKFASEHFKGYSKFTLDAYRNIIDDKTLKYIMSLTIKKATQDGKEPQWSDFARDVTSYV